MKNTSGKRLVKGIINALHFKVPKPKGVILYFHGNADNLKRWGKIAGNLTRFGYDVIVLDYRGFGKSSGPRNEEFYYSDAQFVYNFAKENYGEKNIIVYGMSLGGAFAVKMAAVNEPKFVILEATFFNIQDVVNRWLPVLVTDRISPTMTYHFLSNEHISAVNVPLYHFHGTKDLVIPLKSGKKLFEVFKNSQPEIKKKFIEVSGASHTDLSNFDKFQEELKKILT